MPGRLIQRHDEFAKFILDEPGNAEAFLRERLPPAVVERLSRKPAIDRSESHVSRELRELRGDRVYAMETVDGDEVLIWTMVEHKSAPEADILKQLLKDLAGIAAKGASVRKARGGGRSIEVPAAVYPIILYHSDKDWDIPTDLSEAYGLPKALTRLGLLSFVYTLVNLLQIPDAELSAYPPLRAALLVLKYAQSDADPRVTLNRLLEAAVRFDLTTLIVVVRYVVKESDTVGLDEVRAHVARLLPGEEERVMSPALKQYIDEERPRIIDEARPGILDEGRCLGQVATLLRLLERKFGPLSDTTVTRVRTADAQALEQMTDAFVTAGALEDVIGTIRKR